MYAPTGGDLGVDRVDALLRVYRLVSAPRAHVHLDAADAVRGPLVRDVHVHA